MTYKTVTKNCKYCDKEFQANIYLIRNGHGEYCSHSCSTCDMNIRHGRNVGLSESEQRAYYYSKDPHKRRGHTIKYKYGLLFINYYILLEQQGYQCPICGCWLRNPMANKKVHIDHSHDTNKIRGILCEDCNRGLGSFKDGIVSLKNAIEYLERYKGL